MKSIQSGTDSENRKPESWACPTQSMNQIGCPGRFAPKTLDPLDEQGGMKLQVQSDEVPSHQEPMLGGGAPGSCCRQQQVILDAC